MIEQAIYGGQDGGGRLLLARSPGFLDDWLPAAERLCASFGERPAGVACPGGVFAQPFGPRHVAVVQAADQGVDEAGRPGPLAFRLLILPGVLYDRLDGDPFPIADQFPPDWRARGELPALEWTAGPPPARTVESVRNVLNVPHSATLLGGVQALLDGHPLVFERPRPDADLLRRLWALLPTNARRRMWPASFAFGNACRFHALVVPRADGPDFEGCLHEEQVGDYPEGAYELRLQTAAEAGNQGELDTVFAGRSRYRALRLVFGLVAVVALNLPFVLMWLSSRHAPAPSPTPAMAPAATAKPDQPAAADK